MVQRIEISGIDALNRKLAKLASSGKSSIARASLTGAVAPLKTAIRRQLNSSSASLAIKRAARATIGSSVKTKSGSYTAKAGFGVGKPTKAKKTKAHERNVYGQGGANLAKGVGLSTANIHWFVLGTKQRKTKSGRYTGQIQPELIGLVPVAANAARGAMITEAARRAALALKRESKRR